MPTDLYEVRGAHPAPPFGIPNYVFRSISQPGYLIGDLAFANGAVYEWNGSAWVILTVGGGGSGGTEVFAIAGSGTPSNVTDIPTSGSGVAYNAAGNLWVYNSGWQQQF